MSGYGPEGHEILKIRRRIIGILIVACLVSGFLVVQAGIGLTDSTRGTWHTVQPGETVWSIASQDKQWSTNDVRDWIDSHNHLNGGIVVPGQRILVPVS